jgi:hypothetical protein
MASLTFPTPTQLKNVGEPSANSDAATKYYVDQQIGGGGANANYSNFAGTVISSAQPNITSTGTLASLSVTGNVTGGNLITTGNVFAPNLVQNASTYDTRILLNSAAGIIEINSNGNGTQFGPSGQITLGGASQIVGGTFGGSGITVAGTQTDIFQNRGGNVTVQVGTGGAISNTWTFAQTGAFQAPGLVNAIGNINGANLTTPGALSVVGNSNVGNLGTTNLIATGTGSFGANLNMNTYWINNVGYPNATTDVATKAYVDTLISTGISYHQPVLAATTTSLDTATGGTTAYNSPNGAANGIGAYISTTGVFDLIDTSNVQTVGTRILVKDEANAAWNGVYTYSNTTAITRATDADEYGTGSTTLLSINDYFFTTGGNVNKGVGFVVSAPAGTITFGTSNITFSVFSSSQVYTAGTGINISGTTISANASQTQVTAVGTLTTLSVSGNSNVGNIGATGGTFTTVAGNLTTAIQSNVTRTGTLDQLIVANTVYADGYGARTGSDLTISTTGNGNLIVSPAGTGVTDFSGKPASNISTLSATSNITGGNLITTGTANVGTLAVTGTSNLGPIGNVTITGGSSGQYLQTNGSGTLSWQSISASSISNGNSNVNIPSANGNVNLTAVGNTTVVVTGTGVNVSGTLSTSGSANVGNIGATGAYFTTVEGNLTTAAQPNITSTGTLTSLSVTGNITGGNLVTSGLITATGNITGGNLSTGGNATVGNLTAGSGTGGNITGANLVSANYFTGTLTTQAQPNITSTGTLTSLSVSGNSNIGNIGTGIVTATGNVTGANLITGGIVSATGNVTGNFFIGNGSQLTSVTALNANVSLVSNNQEYRPLLATNTTGNLPFRASAGISWNPSTYALTAGKILLGSGIGAQGITGAYAFGGNTAWQVQSQNGTGTDAQGQEIGRFGSEYTSGASVFWDSYTSYYQGSGASSGWMILNAAGNSVANITGTGITVTGTLSANGNSNVGNLGTARVIATGNISGTQLISNIATGTAPLVVTSTTQVANLNVATAGTVTTNSQPNITSTGTLTSLSVSGNSNIGNIGTGIVTATGNITGANLITGGNVNAPIIVNGGTGVYLAPGPSGYINFFTTGGDKATITDAGNIVASNVIANSTVFAVTANISGNVNAGNVSGTLLTGTLTTASQPNITSTGTLSSLSVSGNSNVGNIGASGVFTGNGSGLSSLAVANIVGLGNIATINKDGNASNILYGNGVFATTPAFKYVREWHVDPVNGSDTNTGAYEKPFLTISQALTSAGNIGCIIYLHAGTYSESVTVSNLNLDIVGLSAGGGVINLSGTWNYAVASGSIRVEGVYHSGAVTISATGDSYFTQCTFDNTLTKSGGGYVSIQASNCQGTGISVTGAGIVAFLNGLQTSLTVNNASASVTLQSTQNLTTAVVTSGSLTVQGGFVFSSGATNNAITSAAGSIVVLGSTRIFNNAGALGRTNLLGFWTINDAQYDRANSVNSGTNLDTTSYFDKILTIGNVSANFLTGTLTTAAQPNITSTGTLTSLSVSGNATVGNLIGRLANGNSNVNIATSNGNVTITSVGNITLTVTGTGANVSGTLSASGNVNGGNLVTSNAVSSGTLTVSGTSNLGAVGNVTITGGTNGYVLSTNGSGVLSWVAQSGGGGSNIANGTSNVNIATSGGNVTTSVGGNANIIVVTGTGANIAGTLSASGNITGANLFGTIRTAAQTVITSIGTLTNLSVSGNANIGNLTVSSNALITAGNLTINNNATVGNIISSGSGGNISNANVISANTFSASGNITGGNISTAGNISGNTNGFAIGYLDIPQVAAGNVTLDATDAGKHYYSTTAGNLTLTIPLNSSVPFNTGTAISIFVQAAGNILVNAASGVTLYMAGNSTAANRVVGTYGMATMVKVATDTWFINGTGVS